MSANTQRMMAAWSSHHEDLALCASNSESMRTPCAIRSASPFSCDTTSVAGGLRLHVLPGHFALRGRAGPTQDLSSTYEAGESTRPSPSGCVLAGGFGSRICWSNERVEGALRIIFWGSHLHSPIPFDCQRDDKRVLPRRLTSPGSAVLASVVSGSA